ncbi:PRC-barrel domain-containing protein [Cellulomonas marina]|uniref:PRC-barrel domain-containing protein n=1 Tax=Cellulomonas marina TaxID=988821 RepID=A0A1I0ZHV9_9CELL|nr:PRC-barrel domain-containing protein [Cellulomonas marina]SFB25244.1 PRC-barrel domain-containing protein [Cellulomonas marina]
MLTQDEVRTIAGATAVDRDGQRLGTVGRVYLDDATGDPAWVTVRTGRFGDAESFVPLTDATLAGDELRLAHDADRVDGAPRVEVDAHLTLEEERTLYDHYGVDDAGGTGATAPVARPGSGMGTEAGTDLQDPEARTTGGRHAATPPAPVAPSASPVPATELTQAPTPAPVPDEDLTGRGLSGTVAGEPGAYGGDPRPAAAGPGPSDLDGGPHAGSTHHAPTAGDGTAGPAGGPGTAPVPGYDLGEADRGEAGRGSSDPGPATGVRHATGGADAAGARTAWDEGRSRMRPWSSGA